MKRAELLHLMTQQRMGISHMRSSSLMLPQVLPPLPYTKLTPLPPLIFMQRDPNMTQHLKLA